MTEPSKVPDIKEPTQIRAMTSGKSSDLLRAIEEIEPVLDKPSVEVGSAIYNTEPHYIAMMLQSVRRQNYANIDGVILVDDGSDKKSTVDYLKDIEVWHNDENHPQFDFWKKVIVIPQDHKGAAAAYNKIFRNATTERCALIGSDDLWSYEFTNAIQFCWKTEDIMAMGAFCIVIDENNTPMRKWGVMGAPFYRVDVFMKEDMWFDETFKKFIDEDHFQRCKKHYDKDDIFRVLREYLYYYRFHGENITERMAELESIKKGKKAFDAARKMAVVTMNHEDIARMFASLMSATYVPTDGELLEYTSIYFLGFGDPGLANIMPQLKARGMTLILQWFPPDIEKLDFHPDIRKILAKEVDVHLASDKKVKAALAKRGIHSEILNPKMLENEDQLFIYRHRFYFLTFGVKQSMVSG